MSDIKSMFDVDKTEQPEVVEEKKNEGDVKVNESIENEEEPKITKEEYEKLKKIAHDNKVWGHKNNQKSVLTNKKVIDLINNWAENDVITYDEQQEALGKIKINDDELTAPVTEENNAQPQYDPKHEQIVNSLNNELSNYKRYHRDESIDHDYMGFYEALPLLPKDQRDELDLYFTNVDASLALEKALMIGRDYNTTMKPVLEKKGNVIDYVKHLEAKNKKIETEYAKLKKEFDGDLGKVSTRTISGRSSTTYLNEKPVAKEGLVDKLFE